MSRTTQEVLYEGWLTKSPPTKRIWRGRWRKRWFILQQGELPAQYILSYYTDRNSRKLKGFIDLDHCEQVDTGLKFQDKKLKFDFMFDIKTPTRTYYLAADTENEMKSWVKCICNVCGLKATSDEEDCKFEEQQVNPKINDAIGSAPISPVSTSPYIPISECITGKTPILPNQPIKDFNTLLQHNMKSSFFRERNHSNDSYDFAPPTYLNCDPKFYDIPRNLHSSPQAKSLKLIEEPTYCNFDKNVSPMQSPTDTESVFTDEDWSHNTLQIDQNLTKNSRPSESSTDIDLTNNKIHKLSLEKKTSEVFQVAPPRPPKSVLVNNSSASYLNLQTNKCRDDASKTENHVKSNSISEDVNNQSFISDEMYDFPRSHNLENSADIKSTLSRRHCYNNAAPSLLEGQIFTYDNSSPKPGTSHTKVFRYGDELLDEPNSPLSQSSSIAHYSNLPSPLLPSDTQLMPPPKVNRGLKPKRKLSDTLSISSSIEPGSPHPAPSVDRKLKPIPSPGSSQCYRNSRRSCENINSGIYNNSSNDQRKKLEYLDLDLDTKNTSRSTKRSHKDSLKSSEASTVYKEVDFMKTEAFNITRYNLEKERNKTLPFLRKT